MPTHRCIWKLPVQQEPRGQGRKKTIDGAIVFWPFPQGPWPVPLGHSLAKQDLLHAAPNRETSANTRTHRLTTDKKSSNSTLPIRVLLTKGLQLSIRTLKTQGYVSNILQEMGTVSLSRRAATLSQHFLRTRLKECRKDLECWGTLRVKRQCILINA